MQDFFRIARGVIVGIVVGIILMIFGFDKMLLNVLDNYLVIANARGLYFLIMALIGFAGAATNTCWWLFAAWIISVIGVKQLLLDNVTFLYNDLYYVLASLFGVLFGIGKDSKFFDEL